MVKMSFLCKIFGHKYEEKKIDLYAWEVVCKRCGKNRDIYNQGEQKIEEVQYFKKKDGKKDDK